MLSSTLDVHAASFDFSTCVCGNANTFSELSAFVAIVCHMTVMWCQLIEDHDDMYHVPMTCMVLEICDEIHKSDFIKYGTVSPLSLKFAWKLVFLMESIMKVNPSTSCKTDIIISNNTAGRTYVPTYMYIKK